MSTSSRAREQYGSSTANLDRRVAIHAFGTERRTWAQFVREQLPFAGGQRVLEVGAGTGMHWATVPDGVVPVLCDLHAPMCAVLRGLGQPVVRCSAEQLPFRTGTFDGVMSMHVLYHVPDPLQAGREMLRVARQGGWLAVATNGPEHMRELGEVAERAGVQRIEAHHLRFSIDDAERLLVDLGLVPRVISWPDELRLPGAGPALDYLDSLGEPLPDAARLTVAEQIDGRIAREGFFRVRKHTALLVAEVP